MHYITIGQYLHAGHKYFHTFPGKLSAHEFQQALLRIKLGCQKVLNLSYQKVPALN